MGSGHNKTHFQTCHSSPAGIVHHTCRAPRLLQEPDTCTVTVEYSICRTIRAISESSMCSSTYLGEPNRECLWNRGRALFCRACSAGVTLSQPRSAARGRRSPDRKRASERASEPGFTETSATRNRETTVVVACQSNKSKYPCKSGQMTNDSMFFLHLSAWCQDMGVRIPLSKVGWDAEWGSCG